MSPAFVVLPEARSSSISPIFLLKESRVKNGGQSVM